MPDSRRDILANIRRSIGAAHLPTPPSATSTASSPAAPFSALVEDFAAELTAVSGTFIATTQAEAPELVVRLVRERSADRSLAWAAGHLPIPKLWQALQGAGVAVADGQVPPSPDRARMLGDLAGIAVGITGVEAAIAETGTLAVLAGPGRPRLASMSVRTHIALFTPQQLYPSLAAWLAARPDLTDALRDRSALTFITGPSRTADIEMTLTVGVHGPREVIAMLVAP
jgi:L-lactate dehydrogenase complex protein LldG